MKYFSEERIPYGTMKEWALQAYYDFCRDGAVAEAKPYDWVMARVAYTFECGFERPIEDLMWHVILLTLSGSWAADWATSQRRAIVFLLEKHGFESLVKDLSLDEVDELSRDLRVLKLIEVN